MPFAYYRRLSPRQKKVYEKSDAIAELRLPDPARLQPHVATLAEALADDERHRVAQACQALADDFLAQFQAPPVRVAVLAVRPSHDWGELHGLYDPTRKGPPTISLWMRTAQRQQVVAFRTFLRTLLHELCHHLDYALLRLAESFHTEGFYKRESSLFRQLVAEDDAAGGPRRRGPARP